MQQLTQRLLADRALVRREGKRSIWSSTPLKYFSIGKMPVRFRNRSAAKQPAYFEKPTEVYVDAKDISRSKYMPHVGKKQSQR